MKSPDYTISKTIEDLETLRAAIEEQYGKGNFTEIHFASEGSFGWFNVNEKGEALRASELGFFCLRSGRGYIFYPQGTILPPAEECMAELCNEYTEFTPKQPAKMRTDYERGAHDARELMICTLIGWQNGMGHGEPENPEYKAYQKMIEHLIAEKSSTTRLLNNRACNYSAE